MTSGRRSDRSEQAEAAGSSSEARGIPAAVWAIGAGLLVVLGVILVVRRRRVSDEDV